MAAASAKRARKPLIPCCGREDFRAVVVARGARLLAGAAMVRLIGASRPRPARSGHRVRAASGWLDGGAGVRQQRTEPTGQPAGAEGDAG